MPDDQEMTENERLANEAIIRVQLTIRRLYGGIPYNWDEEGLPAIHVLQQFVKQHYLYRMNPELWSDWSPDDSPLYHENHNRPK